MFIWIFILLGRPQPLQLWQVLRLQHGNGGVARTMEWQVPVGPKRCANEARAKQQRHQGLCGWTELYHGRRESCAGQGNCRVEGARWWCCVVEWPKLWQNRMEWKVPVGPERYKDQAGEEPVRLQGLCGCPKLLRTRTVDGGAPNDSQDCYEKKEDVTFTHLLVVPRFAIFLNIYLCHFENVIPTENNKVVCVWKFQTIFNS